MPFVYASLRPVLQSFPKRLQRTGYATELFSIRICDSLHDPAINVNNSALSAPKELGAIAGWPVEKCIEKIRADA
jgi:hypothetical protein